MTATQRKSARAEGAGVSELRSAGSGTIGLDTVRVKLAWLWLSAGGLFVTILVAQSLLGRYAADVQEVWGWALPNLVPTLGMIVTVLGYTALDPEQSKLVVRTSFYTIAWTLSLAYLFLLLLTVLLQPLTPYQPIQLMRMANLWLGPSQGLVASALGVLFVSKKSRRP
jgi:hypothetical protein